MRKFRTIVATHSCDILLQIDLLHKRLKCGCYWFSGRQRSGDGGRERERLFLSVTVRLSDYCAVIQRETESLGGKGGFGSSLAAVSAMQCLLLVDPRMLSAWTYVM